MVIDLMPGDCRERMATLEPESVDSIVTDPPYGLSFMGKGWDHGVPGVEFWTEALRVAKPGAHLLAFGGTRMFHRLACAIEDAGWEIRDCVMWVYGSGFPKSHNLSGEWQGWGTALKPACEPVIVARKPLIGTVATNVLAHGTGALNIDGCRVPGEPWKAHSATGLGSVKFFTEGETPVIDKAPHDAGRWPANLIHDGSEEVLARFPVTGASRASNRGELHGNVYDRGKGPTGPDSLRGHNDSGGSAARFFYCAKASRKDRNEGCEALTEKALNWSSGTKNPGSFQSEGAHEAAKNNHPTVKPTDLMRYLCRLVTPPGGVVLDPFMGSGSTGKAAVLEGFDFIGIELEPEYFKIAQARIGYVEERCSTE